MMKAFLASSEMIKCFFVVVVVVLFILGITLKDFSNVETFLCLVDEAYLIIMCVFFVCLFVLLICWWFLDSICQYFIEYFCINVHEEYRIIILFLLLYLGGSLGIRKILVLQKEFCNVPSYSIILNNLRGINISFSLKFW